nr:hypothetical protein [Tanacetum cinerariifolium]
MDRELLGLKLRTKITSTKIDNTFSGSDHEDANEHIERVLEIIDLFHIPNITQDQVMLRAFPMSLTGAISRWLRNKPSGSITTWEDLKIKFLSKYCPPARTAKKIEEINNFQNNANPWYQEQRQSMEESLSKFMSKSAKRHEENSNIIKEIRASTNAAIKNQGASIKTFEIQIGQMSKVLLERGFGSLPSSTEMNLRYHVKSISTTIKADMTAIHHIGSPQYVEKDPGSFTLPCYINNVYFDNAFADLGASISVMPLSALLNLVIEDMDPYLDEEMGEVVVGEPFYKVSPYGVFQFMDTAY